MDGYLRNGYSSCGHPSGRYNPSVWYSNVWYSKVRSKVGHSRDGFESESCCCVRLVSGSTIVHQQKFLSTITPGARKVK